MSFISPELLILLVAVPLLIVLYARWQRRRQRLLANFGAFGLAPKAGQGARRNVPAVLFLIAIAVLIIALARPQMTVSLPRVGGTVILAFDVSGSMAADDLKPTRMEAAKVAARDFVAKQPRGVQIGVVAFSDTGLTVQPPTDDEDLILATIDRLTPERGTSLANGILMSLDAIAAGDEPPTNYYRNATPEPTPTPTPMPKGTYEPAVIILLTDGENTVSPDPMEAAQQAIDRGVRIYTVGVGSPGGVNLKVNGFTVRTQLDEPTLKKISELTDGTYYNAQTEQDLQSIYQNIQPELSIKPEKMEITSILAGISLVCLLIGGALSLSWFSRLP
ncbi:MAG: VWA domain-containing protein [Anaerolineae bacterium]